MEIRKLTAADADTWWQLRLEALEAESSAFGSSVEEHRAVAAAVQAAKFRTPPEGALYLGAFDGDALVGMMTFMPHEGMKERHKGGIYGVYVTNSHRGRGIARELLQNVLMFVRKNPEIEQIVLAVGTENTAAASLYRSLGFVTFGVERRALKLSDRYVDEEHMVLFLTAVSF